MCIIAAIPAGSEVSKDQFYSMWENNPDGGGIMYAHKGKITVLKELHKVDILWLNYVAVKRLNVPIVLHFRIGTSGTKDAYNIHPFKVNDNLYFCHNGILNITVPVESKENDTQIFNNAILKELPDNFVFNKATMKLLEAAIGSGNKFVFLTAKGTIKIVNKKAGNKLGDIWFSNTGYKPKERFFSWNNKKHDIDAMCENCFNLDPIKYDRLLGLYVCAACSTAMREDYFRDYKNSKDEKRKVYNDKL